jgi:hypothetical protein
VHAASVVPQNYFCYYCHYYYRFCFIMASWVCRETSQGENMRRGCMKCVGYLPDQPSQALNKNAKVKLHMHGAKLCICSAWFFMH